MTGWKKNLKYSSKKKAQLIDPNNKDLSISRQAKLLWVSRSSFYYAPKINLQDLEIMHRMDEIYTKHPYYGTRRLKVLLNQEGYSIGRQHIGTLMKKLWLETLYPKKKTSIQNKNHKTYPYLLRWVKITKPNHVWSTDITYIRLSQGWVYLTAVIDWFSRYILSWETSISLESSFCQEALRESLTISTPQIFNTDQWSQFTCLDFLKILKDDDIQISMDGKGRCLDNVFVERLWRTIKQEEVYLKEYTDPLDAYSNLKEYINFYNHERPHSSLNYKTPAQVYKQWL